jgi:transcriptional regulator with XRE-family HTH domain
MGATMARVLERTASIRIPGGFSGRLRKARAARGCTRKELAAALGINAGFIATWENGQSFWISPAMLDALATALHVEPAWLLTRPLVDA